MADVVLTPIQLTTGVFSADVPIASGQAINAADTYKLLQDEDNRFVIQVNNTFAGAKVVTIEAGDFFAKGLGALTQSLAQNDVRFVVVESARHRKNTGYVHITFEAGTTGFLQALKIPK